ncbi:hypothetical protein [Planctomycetes bacterium TBK1r]
MLAAQHAEDGDLSRFSDDEILGCIEWDNADVNVVEVLVECRWLDRDEGRLTVHDWAEHCPNYVKERVKKREQRSKGKGVGDGTRGTMSGDCPQTVPGRSTPTQPNPTLPNQTKPNPTNSGRNPESDQMNKTNEAALRLAVEASKALSPAKFNDRQLIAKAAVIAVASLDENWFRVALGGVTKTSTKNPCGKFHTCCRDHAERLHSKDFDQLAAQVNIPKTFYSRLEKEIGGKKRPRVPTSPPKSPPIERASTSQTEMNRRRNEIEQQLLKVG